MVGSRADNQGWVSADREIMVDPRNLVPSRIYQFLSHSDIPDIKKLGKRRNPTVNTRVGKALM